jgi:hypothetical protein
MYHLLMASTLAEMDQVIIRYADTLSAEMISFKLDGDMTPEQVLARRQQLLEIPDALTALQQDQLISLKMRQLVVELEEMPRTARNAEVILRGLEGIGKRLDQRISTNTEDLEKHYAFEGQALLGAVVAALAHMRGSLTGADKISETEWDAHMEKALRFAQLSIDNPDHPDLRQLGV